MLSVTGIYDGKKIRLFERIKIRSPRKVIVTFLDLDDDEMTSEELHFISDKGGAFNFLHAEREDIYTVNELKVKYNDKQ